MNIEPATILIVDDEPQNRKLLETLLHAEGYRTVSVTSGEEALASVNQSTPDLILLDIMMPGMDGYQVAKVLKLRPSSAAVPIVMITAQIDRGARIAGLNAGAEEFLTKPIDRAELWLRVRNLLRLKAFADFQMNHNALLEEQVQARSADLRRFRTAMDSAADAIMLIDCASLGFVEFNTTACEMLGFSREEFLEAGPLAIFDAGRERLEAQYDAIVPGEAARAPEEMHLVCKDGAHVLVEARIHAQESGGKKVIVAVMRDIAARKRVELQLHHLAHYDALTGLPNRNLFYDTLGKTLALAPECDWQVAILCIDLDNFKSVNDTLGHALGDELLVQFSARLSSCIRIRDTVGRLGGDEFALILIMQDGQQGAALVAEKILEATRETFDLQGHAVDVTASIGIALHPDDGTDAQSLMKYADTAMYRAKQAGRNAFRFFTLQMNSEVLARLALETALRKAVEERQFEMHYQPKVELRSGRISGVEALLRWKLPGDQLATIDQYMPVLEETGMIVRLGTWVIDDACRQIAHWIAVGAGPIQVSINVSGRQFVEGDLDGDVGRSMARHGIPAELVELELTETSLMANTERTIATLQKLKKRGVSIAVDDFGTGYSSLAYLRRFPIDRVKIDISFIQEVTTNADDAAIVVAIIRMARSLKLDVVAEGVETAAQLGFLRRQGCDQIQGFYFSPAVPAIQLEAMLLGRRTLSSSDGESPRTLLLVDDEERILTALRHLLAQDGYRILCAQSAAQGLEMLALHEVEVLLCDERMPGMSGTEFFDRVKDLYPRTFRIVLSGQADPGGIIDAINRGAIHRFYGKPWDNRSLRDSVGKAFQHQREVRDPWPEHSEHRKVLHSVEMAAAE